MCCPAYFRWWSPLTSIFIRDGQVDIDSLPESPPISRERFSSCPTYKLSTNPKFLWGLEVLLRNVWKFHFISLYSHRKKIPITHIMHILYSNHILIPTSNYGYYASLFGWIFTCSHDIPKFSFQLCNYGSLTLRRLRPGHLRHAQTAGSRPWPLAPWRRRCRPPRRRRKRPRLAMATPGDPWKTRAFQGEHHLLRGWPKKPCVIEAIRKLLEMLYVFFSQSEKSFQNDFNFPCVLFWRRCFRFAQLRLKTAEMGEIPVFHPSWGWIWRISFQPPIGSWGGQIPLFSRATTEWSGGKNFHC